MRGLIVLLCLPLAGCVREGGDAPPPRHLVTVTAEPGGVVVSTPPGISCGTVCTGSFTRNAVVTLEPQPGPGVRFAGWQGACAGKRLCTLAVHGDVEVRARFVLAATGGPVPEAVARFSDLDKDGIGDDVDRCPVDPEDHDDFEDQDGCPDGDNDGDGVVDADDKCPNLPEDKDGDADDDGCPEADGGDRDGDGLPDASDMCPDEPEDMDGFQDQDGCPDPDNDADGILDVDDLCPNEPENLNGVNDADGCPEKH